jgi:hypothetical protein
VTAHRTASTVLAKSATTLSPAVFEDAAPVRGYQVADNGPICFQPRKRANLVAPHQPAVAGNVGSKDRSKFALYRVNRHALHLLSRV